VYPKIVNHQINELLVQLSGALLRLMAGLLLGVVLSLAASTAMAQQNLPSMGEPADNALSPIEERELGEQFMRQIRAQLPLVRDVQLTEYIQGLGTRLALAAGKNDTQNFTFFIIEDPQINAFAIPGGYVGVNSGLIAAMDQEEQLASVIAHEVAHVTQRHHARAFATGNRATLSTAAAVLAAIIIGQASPQAGQAALAAGLAASQQSAINFTRSNEVEADRIGIEILANANYDARAMAESFAILRRKNSLNTSNGQLEYLRTHPLDNNRIAEATDRAGTKPLRPRQPGVDYDLFRARLAVLTAEDAGELMRTYQAQHLKSPDVGTSYALALMHQRANRLSEAKQYLAQLDTLISAHPMVELLRADIAGTSNGGGDDAVLSALSELYPDRYSIVEKRLDQLVRDRRLGEARKVANDYLRGTANPDPLAWRQLASIQERLDDQAGSHESLARYFEALDELERASSQLELALRQVPPASQDQLRLEASLKDLRARAVSLR
jgi:predicted Zn-dependent protease